MTIYKVEVRQERRWDVYVEARNEEIAGELACDILEEDLESPKFEDWDADIQRKYDSDALEEIPKGTPIHPWARSHSPKECEYCENPCERHSQCLEEANEAFEKARRWLEILT